MSTQIAEAPPSSSSASASKPLPSAKEAGLVGIAEAFNKMAAKPASASETVEAQEAPKATEKPVAAKSALLDSLPVEEPVKPAKEEPKAMEAKRAADWKQLKEEREQFRTEAETLRKEVEKSKAWEKELTELRPKAEKADEFSKKLHEVAFEKTETYRNLVVDQESIKGQARELAKEFEVPEDTIDKALLIKGKRRLDFLEEALGNPTAAGKFDRMLEMHDQIEATKAKEIARSRETAEKMSSAERELALNEDARKKQEVLQAFDAAMPKFQSKLPGYFSKREGDDAHNAMVDEIVTTARTIAETNDPEIQAEALGLAAIARSLMKRNPELAKENAQLRKRLEEYTANSPRVPAGGGNGDSASGSERVGMMDRLKQGVLR